MEKAFKKQTIEKMIKYNVNKWIASIDDKELQKEVKSNYIVTGGAIASMLLGELPNDYDVYFKSPEVCAKVANYYISKLKIKNDKISKIESRIEPDGSVKIMIKSAGIASEGDDGSDYNYFELGGDIQKFLNKQLKKKNVKPYSIAMMTDNAISLTNNIQIITRFTGPIEEIHKNYDFVHTTNAYSEETGLVLKMDAVLATISKELKYVGSLYPICSLFRMRKFIKRGWTITAGEILKISWDISRLDLSDRLVLQTQTTGIDSAYFYEFFNILKENSDKEINRTYLYEIINKVFDELSEDDLNYGMLTSNIDENGEGVAISENDSDAEI